MCEPKLSVLATAGGLAQADALPGATRLAGAAAAHEPSTHLARVGTRRRRLWELDGHAFCPVVGVCLPMPVLRQLASKLDLPYQRHDDYDLHCTAVTQCKQRNAVAEAVHRDLDRRYAAALRETARLKSTAELTSWWLGGAPQHDLAGAFWACLTHGCCDTSLEYRVLGDVHMLQHQVGMATRVDQHRLDAALQQRDGLLAELAGLRERHAQRNAEHGRQLDAWRAEQAQLRAELLARDAALQRANEMLGAQRPSDAQRRAHDQLINENQRLSDRLMAMQGALRQAQVELRALRCPADAARAGAAAPAGEHAAAPPPPVPTPARLDNQSVLCVGGRAASVPVYRKLIERTGGRFLHHDGGYEQGVTLLESTLSAADLVICQTGCVSHDAYWRVKDHCKRTGKRCVFVETPSRAALQRALDGLAEVARCERIAQ